MLAVLASIAELFVYSYHLSVLLLSFSIPAWLIVIDVSALIAPLLLLAGSNRDCYAKNKYFLSIWNKLKQLYTCFSAGEPNSDMELLETLNGLSLQDINHIDNIKNSLRNQKPCTIV